MEMRCIKKKNGTTWMRSGETQWRNDGTLREDCRIAGRKEKAKGKDRTKARDMTKARARR